MGQLGGQREAVLAALLEPLGSGAPGWHAPKGPGPSLLVLLQGRKELSSLSGRDLPWVPGSAITTATIISLNAAFPKVCWRCTHSNPLFKKQRGLVSRDMRPLVGLSR